MLGEKLRPLKEPLGRGAEGVHHALDLVVFDDADAGDHEFLVDIQSCTTALARKLHSSGAYGRRRRQGLMRLGPTRSTIDYSGQ